MLELVKKEEIKLEFERKRERERFHVLPIDKHRISKWKNVRQLFMIRHQFANHLIRRRDCVHFPDTVDDINIVQIIKNRNKIIILKTKCCFPSTDRNLLIVSMNIICGGDVRYRYHDHWGPVNCAFFIDFGPPLSPLSTTKSKFKSKPRSQKTKHKCWIFGTDWNIYLQSMTASDFFQLRVNSYGARLDDESTFNIFAKFVEFMIHLLKNRLFTARDIENQ